MKRVLLFCGSAALLFAASGEAPNLSGEWQLDAARSRNSSAKSAALTIQQDQDDIRIREAGGAEMKCNMFGKECTFSEGGRPVHATVYHNGPKLVVMEFHGKNRDVVVKKRLALSDDGNTLTMEVTPMSPAGQAETRVFAKKQ